MLLKVVTNAFYLAKSTAPRFDFEHCTVAMKGSSTRKQVELNIDEHWGEVVAQSMNWWKRKKKRLQDTR